MKRLILFLSVLGAGTGAFLASASVQNNEIKIEIGEASACPTWSSCSWCASHCDCDGEDSKSKTCLMKTETCGPWQLFNCTTCSESAGCDDD